MLPMLNLQLLNMGVRVGPASLAFDRPIIWTEKPADAILEYLKL